MFFAMPIEYMTNPAEWRRVIGPHGWEISSESYVTAYFCYGYRIPGATPMCYNVGRLCRAGPFIINQGYHLDSGRLDCL